MEQERKTAVRNVANESAARKAETGKKEAGSKSFWTVVILALLYIISPIDIIPESILGPAGFLDDAVVLAYLIKRVLARFRR